MALINEAYRENLEVAAAIYNGPRQMMGLGKDVHTIMAGNIAGLWAPDGWKALNEGLDVQKTLKNY
ncbi:hypothetical protein [Afifella pfennigii]|uniref:hypothetical protein n=1 Tax=Afifella pfennigii TaxID=209897 RepID=UPI00047EE781|nr:hypothetical protein [Afifella pfennigii]